MIAVVGRIVDAVDDDRRAGVAYVLAQGGGDVERIARLQAEIELVGPEESGSRRST